MTRYVWCAVAILAIACGDDDGPGEVDMNVGGDGDVVEQDMFVSTPCGNGEVGAGEMCDTGIPAGMPGACPTSCDDGDPCTVDALEGSACTSVCTITRITDTITGDMCCPDGALPADDGDCMGDCGNGMIEAGEVCDIAIADGMPGACPEDCDDGVVCTTDSLMNAGSCAAMCTTTDIVDTDDGSDGCCPAGATNATDTNCSATCGDGTVDAGETCDTDITAGMTGACPTACDDEDPCTQDRLLSADTCSATCIHPEVAPMNGDSCCPTGANALNDDDCSAVCGNNVTEVGETCDDGNLTAGDGCDESCQTEPTAMRITSIGLRDPHVYFVSCTLDATATANSIFQMAVDDFTISTVGVFRPLDPSATTSPFDVYPEAMCMGGSPTDVCAAAGTQVMTTANNTATGACYTPDPSTLDYPGTAPNSPTDNCFATDPETVTLNLNGAALLLEDAVVAGEYAGDRIENGILAGFVTYATAMDVMVPNPIGGGSERLYDLLRGGGCTGATDDDDPRTPGGATDEGWWFYIDYEAERVSWTD